MFDRLNAIPWVDLTHAYGSAEEVPMWLRQLASGDEETRRRAIWHLTGSICHQGWISPATGYAIPYLIELLREPTVQEKEAILELLAEIADADPELDEGSWRENAGVPIWNVPEHIPFKNTQEEIHKGLPVYLALLDAANPTMRLQTSSLLAHLVESSLHVRTHLIEALHHETDAAIRANLVLAIGQISQPVPDEWRFLTEIIQAGDYQRTDLTVFCASLTLARLARRETPIQVIQLLAGILLDPPEELALYLTLPLRNGHVWRAAALALGYLGKDRLSFLLPDLFEQLPRVDRQQAGTLVEMLLFLCMPDQEHERETLWTREELTLQQRKLLSLVYERSDLWEFGVYPRVHELFRAYDLPRSRTDLAIFLGREEKPPVKKVVSHPQRSKGASSQPDRLGIFRGALALQYPTVKAHHMGSSSAHNLVSVNDNLMFRVPRNLAEMESMEREIALLQALQGRVALPIPNPLYVSDQTCSVGRAFMGYSQLPGKPLYKEMLESVEKEADAQSLIGQIVSFLAELHHIPLDDLAHLALPVRHQRERYANLYARVRESIFPQMSTEEREQASASFEVFLDTAEHFAIPLVLVHGSFGPQCILYNARDRALGGILDLKQAGLGDPASDFGRLLGPQGYGPDVLRVGEPHYPGIATLYERIQFYAFASSMQDAIAKIERQHQRNASKVANQQTFFPE